MTETESVQEEIQEVEAPFVEQTEGDIKEEALEQEQPEEVVEQQVPLAALQKERRKRQEAEGRAKLFEELQAKQLRDQAEAQPQQEAEDQYESVTKGELGNYEKSLIRKIDERSWIRENPEKADEVNEKLKEFLKQRPNLTSAIEAATNRYQEAWTLMNALSPRQKVALSREGAAPKKVAPGSPSTVPKSAGMNQAVDVMAMNDTEYLAWRKAQRKSR